MERAKRLRRPTVAAERDAMAGLPPQDLGMVGYLRCDAQGLVQAANSTIEAWLGMPSGHTLNGRMLSSIVGGEIPWRDWMQLRQPVSCRFDLQDAEGHRVPVKAEVRPAQVQGSFELWMVEDLANELIARVARLEASLTLTAGTVHDVNNVLTVLSGNLFLLTERARDQPKLCEQARRARNAAARGSTLLRELLTYNREPDGEGKCICPGNHVSALKPLLMRTVASGPDRALKVTVDGDPGSVMASAARFESVVINLVINARDALRARGKIHVRVGNVHLGEGRAGKLGLPADRYVCVSVADNGGGIPQRHLHRVTEPLFSTKRRNGGSGLGLSMVKHFAESCGGALCIDSVEGRGTRVRLWLPRIEKLAETTANMTLPLSTLPGGDERLLVLSRDGDLRGSIQQILETLGYTVLVAASIEDVERVLGGSPGPALVISERSSGSQRVERRWLAEFRQSYPSVRHLALLQAGARVEEAAPDADAHVYRPVSVPELAKTVRRALERS
jgi:signal transduction histidine kinase/CheY-like chemotaxis protein